MGAINGILMGVYAVVKDCLRKCKISTFCNCLICVLFKRRKQNLLLCKTGGRVVH